jgi:DNA-binding transcriptional MerR regulator
VLIGELARRSGLPARTIRFYERLGVLSAPSRKSNGYRDYDEGALAGLEFVNRSREAGLTLREITSILAVRGGGDPPCRNVLELLDSRLAEIDARIDQLLALRHDLRNMVDRGRTLDPADCDGDQVCQIISAPR